VFKLISSGFPILLGTDCHNMKTRCPNMDAGRQVLAHKYGAAYLEQMDALGAGLLKI
jgi:protein-tyrosine phosphatase